VGFFGRGRDHRAVDEVFQTTFRSPYSFAKGKKGKYAELRRAALVGGRKTKLV